MRFHSRLVLACAMLATVAGIGTAPYAHAEGYGFPTITASAPNSGLDTNTTLEAPSRPTSQPRTGVVLCFAGQNHQPSRLNNSKGIIRCVTTPKCSWT
jgi:hypothetical protein